VWTVEVEVSTAPVSWAAKSWADAAPATAHTAVNSALKIPLLMLRSPLGLLIARM
jgi:hypothetical protein